MENTNELNNTMDDSIPENELPRNSYLTNITEFEAKTFLGNIFYLIDLINYLQKEFLHHEIAVHEAECSYNLEEWMTKHRNDIEIFRDRMYAIQKKLTRMNELILSIKDVIYTKEVIER